MTNWFSISKGPLAREAKKRLRELKWIGRCKEPSKDSGQRLRCSLDKREKDDTLTKRIARPEAKSVNTS